MALESKVPIVIAAGDFKEKNLYLGKKISVEELETRSYESIMQELQDYFQNYTEISRKVESKNILKSLN